MIRLQPIATEQTITIIPRNYDFTGKKIDATIIEDGTNKTETLLNLTALSNGNYIDVKLTSLILKENSVYLITLTLNNKLWYSDKIYITSNVNKESIFTLNNNDYVDTGATGDEYIIL